MLSRSRGYSGAQKLNPGGGVYLEVASTGLVKKIQKKDCWSPCPAGFVGLLYLQSSFSMSPRVNIENNFALQAEKIPGQGHSSHVTNVQFAANDSLLTAGGKDMALFQWRLTWRHNDLDLNRPRHNNGRNDLQLNHPSLPPFSTPPRTTWFAPGCQLKIIIRRIKQFRGFDCLSMRHSQKISTRENAQA